MIFNHFSFSWHWCLMFLITNCCFPIVSHMNLFLSRSGADTVGFRAGSASGTLSLAGSGGSLVVPLWGSSARPASRPAGEAAVGVSNPANGSPHGSGAPEFVCALCPLRRLLRKSPQRVLLLQNVSSERPGAFEPRRAPGVWRHMRAVGGWARGAGCSDRTAAEWGQRERSQPRVSVLRLVSQRPVAGSEVPWFSVWRAAAWTSQSWWRNSTQFAIMWVIFICFYDYFSMLRCHMHIPNTKMICQAANVENVEVLA